MGAIIANTGEPHHPHRRPGRERRVREDVYSTERLRSEERRTFSPVPNFTVRCLPCPTSQSVVSRAQLHSPLSPMPTSQSVVSRAQLQRPLSPVPNLTVRCLPSPTSQSAVSSAQLQRPLSPVPNFTVRCLPCLTSQSVVGRCILFIHDCRYILFIFVHHDTGLKGNDKL